MKNDHNRRAKNSASIRINPYRLNSELEFIQRQGNLVFKTVLVESLRDDQRLFVYELLLHIRDVKGANRCKVRPSVVRLASHERRVVDQDLTRVITTKRLRLSLPPMNQQVCIGNLGQRNRALQFPRWIARSESRFTLDRRFAKLEADQTSAFENSPYFIGDKNAIVGVRAGELQTGGDVPSEND